MKKAFPTIDDLPLTEEQKVHVLEWFAWKIWRICEEAGGDPDYGGKSYDPLEIELMANGSGIAHSYVFDLGDGGRHHPFVSLVELEKRLEKEAIEEIRELMEWAREEGEE